MGSTLRTAMEPPAWELIPDSDREWVLLGLRDAARNETDPPGGDLRLAKAYRAARNALKDAAPYPDEALAFAMPDGQHVEFEGVSEYRGKRYVRVEDCNRSLSIVVPKKLRPLTPCAVEVIEMIRKGTL